MTQKQIDPNDSYIVRELFACEAGHFLPPGFTHWESGECCPWGGHDEDENPHLYWRLMLVPTKDMEGNSAWDKLLANPNRWGQLPLAPPGLKEGMRVGSNEKTRS